jgi:hypothetical protein
MGQNLGEKLFLEIQSAQGFAFISDACEEWDDVLVMARARDALKWELECVKILRKFIHEHIKEKDETHRPRKTKSG